MTAPTGDMAMAPLAVGVSQLAALLGVSRRHVERLDALGKLPAAVRLGRAKRWTLEELRAWLAAGAPDRREWEARKSVDRAR